jgi:hypothetical protein
MRARIPGSELLKQDWFTLLIKITSILEKKTDKVQTVKKYIIPGPLFMNTIL